MGGEEERRTGVLATDFGGTLYAPARPEYVRVAQPGSTFAGPNGVYAVPPPPSMFPRSPTAVNLHLSAASRALRRHRRV